MSDETFTPDGWCVQHDPDTSGCRPWHLYPDSENGPAIGQWRSAPEARAARSVLETIGYTPVMWLHYVATRGPGPASSEGGAPTEAHP